MLERDVAKAIDAYLTGTLGLRNLGQRDHGGRFRKRTTGVGMPDRWGMLPNGRIWCVEIKAPDARGLKPGTKPRANEAKQHEVRDYLVANGALYITATSVFDVHAMLNPLVLAAARASAVFKFSKTTTEHFYNPERDES
jgi:hypothetical protein